MKKQSPLKNLILITETGLSVIIPTVLMIFLGVFLRDRFGLSFLLPVCIVLGLSAGVLSAWRLLRHFAPKPSDDEGRESYDLLKNWRQDGDEK